MRDSTLSERDVNLYIEQLHQEFPNLKVSSEKPWWLQWIFDLPLLERLGWDVATQTIGSQIFLSCNWENYSASQKLAILRHEREHLLQFMKYGVVLMAFLYLFIFFPVGFAYFRAKFERAGYAETIASWVEYWGESSVTYEEGRRLYLRVFTGSTYFWMFPFKKLILRWFEEDWQKAIGS